MALTGEKPRVFEKAGSHPDYNEHPIAADTVIYDGAAVTLDNSGNATPLNVAHTENGFAGFCIETCDNSGGAAGVKKVKVLSTCFPVLDVAGVASNDNVNDGVYALDDDTFTLTASGALQIGKGHRHETGTKIVVAAEATERRSV